MTDGKGQGERRLYVSQVGVGRISILGGKSLNAELTLFDNLRQWNNV